MHNNGWQCPICKKVLAPFVQECPCKGQGIETKWTSTSTSSESSTITLHNYDSTKLEQEQTTLDTAQEILNKSLNNK